MKRTAALAAVALVSACTTAPTPLPSPSPPLSLAAGCAMQVHQDQLPEWARGGFTGDARVPYALSRSGQMAAIMFGYPLSQPPAEGRNNKILWVSAPAAATSRDPAAPPDFNDLVIDARLDGRGEPVQRRIDGGPGPSIVDLPGVGCWRLELRWAGRTDIIDLEYGVPR